MLIRKYKDSFQGKQVLIINKSDVEQIALNTIELILYIKTQILFKANVLPFKRIHQSGFPKTKDC